MYLLTMFYDFANMGRVWNRRGVGGRGRIASATTVQQFKELVALLLQGAPRPNTYMRKIIDPTKKTFRTETALTTLLNGRAIDRLLGINSKGDIEKYVGAVRVLLDAGVNPNVRDNDGNTALHVIASNMAYYYDGYRNDKRLKMIYKKLFTLLIDEHSANPFIKNKRGQTPLDLWNEEIRYYLNLNSDTQVAERMKELKFPAYTYLANSMERIHKRATMRAAMNARGVNRNAQQKILKNSKLTGLGPTNVENSSGLRDLHARLGLSQKNAPSSKRNRQLKLNKEVLILKKMGKI